MNEVTTMELAERVASKIGITAEQAERVMDTLLFEAKCDLKLHGFFTFYGLGKLARHRLGKHNRFYFSPSTPIRKAMQWNRFAWRDR